MEERERGRNINVRQTHIDGLFPIHVPTRVGIKPVTQVHALNWESNLRPFGPWADILTTEQDWPGLAFIFFKRCWVLDFWTLLQSERIVYFKSNWHLFYHAFIHSDQWKRSAFIRRSKASGNVFGHLITVLLSYI